ncbi:hypothetical protein J4E80_008389 [Alternaria sp. BMP 0032]|nr:hypothetical protein J4E80_008389 [Alternaria sp. BMP 0032]
MSKQACSELGGGPSVKKRIQALYDHRDGFGKIAEFPQAGVYLTVPEDLARVRAYVESEVFRCRRAVNCYLQKSVQPGEPSPTETTHREVMMPYVEAVLLFGRVVETSEKFTSSSPPSKKATDLWRACNRVKVPGMRAANGEIASLLYGQRGDPIPYNVATVKNEDLSPMAQFICDWVLDPLVRYISGPPRDLFSKLPMYKRRFPVEGKDSRRRIFTKSTVEGVANACVYVLAILILIAPIATFTVVGEQSQRIVIIPLFCLLLAASAQFMGTSATPSFIMVIA